MWRERGSARRPTRIAVLAAVVASVGVVSACSASSPKAATSPSARVAKQATVRHPAVPKPNPLRWAACSSKGTLTGLQCASLDVPLDYTKPAGTQITLELSRQVHTSSAREYLGAILSNPGGPGGSGLGMPFLGAAVPRGVGGRFDWIGWDPRGVGASRPAIHCIANYFGTDRPSYSAPAQRAYWLKQADRYASACGRNAGALLQHMTTEDNARDMDVIRQALGQSRISYYGFSWGSYLGQVYLTLFPGRVKRVVLDGVVNPHRAWYAANFDQDVAFERAMRMFFAWVARHNGVYGLGTTEAAVYRAVDRQMTKLAVAPAEGRLGPDELIDALVTSGYGTPSWAENAANLARLVHKGDGSGLLSTYLDHSAGADNENGYAVYNAVQCTDTRWPAWPRTLADSEKVSRTSPFETWSNTWFNAPCLTWPAVAHAPVTIRASSALPNILLIAETYDAATPFSGALATRSLFPTSSLIEGVGGSTHAGSLHGVSCTDEAVASYLATGRTPPRRSAAGTDLRCPSVPPPPASMG